MARLRAAAQDEEPDAPCVRGRNRWRDAAAIFPRADAMPVMLCAALTAGRQLGVQIGVHGGAL
eukprot:10903975-Lingulodinium_polyedra.AAC.1